MNQSTNCLAYQRLKMTEMKSERSIRRRILGKSRQAQDFGRFQLIDPRSNFVVTGGLTAAEVVAYCAPDRLTPMGSMPARITPPPADC